MKLDIFAILGFISLMELFGIPALLKWIYKTTPKAIKAFLSAAVVHEPDRLLEMPRSLAVAICCSWVFGFVLLVAVVCSQT